MSELFSKLGRGRNSDQSDCFLIAILEAFLAATKRPTSIAYLAWLDTAHVVSILRDRVRSIFRNNYRSLSDWRLYKIEQHVQNCTHDRGITPPAFESHVFVLSVSCCRRTLNTVPSWICQILDKGGRSNESIGKIPEVCRRMRSHGQIRAIPGEQSYVGSFGGEMDSVR
jgi:hypothetical protein